MLGVTGSPQVTIAPSQHNWQEVWRKLDRSVLLCIMWDEEFRGEYTIMVAGSPTVAAACKVWFGDKDERGTMSPLVMIALLKGFWEENKCSSVISSPVSTDEAVGNGDSQKATSPGACWAVARPCVAMKVFQAALVAGRRLSLAAFHADGILAPVVA